ncbi:Kae1-associated serine/threonine protein kinase [Candidatus Micrarchaeota archaeon]|nr:Kae1-associated serine/threonine protein kinase [Candidatus Micrarchaeota archaeon]
MKQIAKGAEAELLEFKFGGKAAILKRRAPKKYRLEQLDKKLRETRTKKEAKVLFSAKMAGIRCPLIYNIDLKKSEIVLEKLEGIQMRELFASKSPKIPSALISAGKNLGKLHFENICHGDLTTANILCLKNGEIAIIDFGISDFSSSLEDKATDLLVFKKSTNDDQFELFLQGYAEGNKTAKQVIRQLAEIEKRGRYVTRAQAG